MVMSQHTPLDKMVKGEVGCCPECQNGNCRLNGTVGSGRLGVYFLILFAFEILGIPDDAVLADSIKYRGLANKLRQCPRSPELEHWLVEELKKGDDEPLDPSIWD